MGQQQLLLIVLGIIIVGIAIAVGVNMFQSGAVDSNRQSIISDLANLSAKAQRFYRTPVELGGGSQDFNNFAMGRLDLTNANGVYRVFSSAPDANPDAVPAAANPGDANTVITSSADSIYVYAWGNEDGDDASFKVQAYATVSATAITTTIVN